MANRSPEALLAQPGLTQSPFWIAFLISPEVILIHRSDGTIMGANPAAQEKLGYSIEELEGMNLLDIVEVSEGDMRKRTQDLLSQGELVFQAIHRRKDGTTFESEVHTRRVMVEGEELIVGIGTDITELRLAEMLNRALERMSSFIGSIVDFDEIMRSTVKAAKEAIGTDSAIIILRQEDEWKLAYESGFNQNIPKGASFTVDQSNSVSIVIQTGKPLLINDVKNDRRLNQKYAAQYGITSLLMAPLRVQGNVIGVIGFFYHHRHGIFSDNHVDFANKLAFSISLLLETTRAAQSQKQTEAFFRTVVETVPDGIVVVDGEGVVTFVNKEAERLIGIPREKIVHHSVDDLRRYREPSSRKIIPLDRTPFWLLLSGRDKVQGMDMKTSLSDGSEAYVSVNVLPIYTLEGRFNGSVASLTDITERRRIREQLARDKEEMATIMETTPSGIILYDRDGRIAFLNRSAEAILGVEREEVLGRSFDSPEWQITDYEGGTYRPERLPFNLVASTGRPLFGARHAIVRPDGRMVLLLFNAAPLQDQGGALSGVIASMQDVTTLMATEKALRISMKTSNDIIQQMPSGILLFQYKAPAALTLLSVNPTADAILGGLESRIGMDFDQIWREGAFFATKEEFLEVVRTGKTLWREGVHYSDISVDGNFTFRAFYLPNDRLCINFDDVTERIREAALRRDAFEQIEHNIEDFATLVDRIRNPLSAIMAQAESGVSDDQRILRRAAEIEYILTQLDRGWLESEKVRDFLKKTL